MSDDKSPAKPRRRRLYQEATEEPVARSDKGTAKAAEQKPAAKQAVKPEAKPAAQAAPAKPAAAAKASTQATGKPAEKSAPQPEAKAAAPQPEKRAEAKAAEQPAVPPIEGDYIAAAEQVKIKTEPTYLPQRLHESPLLCRMKAKQAVRDHALLSGSTAAVPVPILDMVADAAVQVRMIKRLAEIYGIDFAEERAKTLAVAALGGFSAGWAAGGLLRYASFALYFANFWPSAILSAAITYAIGQVFIHHFEQGGGLQDLSPDAAASILKEKAMNLRRKKAGMKAAEAV
jgi:uncharacterized protein (DUF697 family)